MFCPNCGKKLSECTNFCTHCGHSLPATPHFTPAHPSPEKTSFFLANKVWLICAALICLAVVLVVVLNNAFSLEKRLIETVWWAEPTFYNEGYDYSNSEWFKEEHPGSPVCGYYVEGKCESYLFCEYGTIRINRYSAPEGYGGSYLSTHEITAANYPSDYSWGAYTDNDKTWSLLDDKRLSIGKEVYFWDNHEAEDTWYMDATTLRIGNTYFTKDEPRINKVTGLPPYWCKNCGKEGPYTNECPECESTEKIG